MDTSTGDRQGSRTPAYGAVARALHWATVLGLATQFAIGYLAVDPGQGRGRGRGRGRGEGSGNGRGRGRGGDVDLDAVLDDGWLTAHAALGVAILVITGFRWWWRHHHGLPPWSPALGRRERVLAHWTERALYAALVAMPATGLWLVLAGDGAVTAHVLSHVVALVAVIAHVALVLKHQWIQRDGLLRRMW